MKNNSPDLSVDLAGIKLSNPIMTASGCCGYGEELETIFGLDHLGAIVTKSITYEPRLGHPVPRTVETAGGMLNAIGLANVGLEKFISDKMPFLRNKNTKVIVNVAGARLSEYVDICARLNDVEGIDAIELNISCPNVDEGGMEIGRSARLTEQTVAEVKKVFSKPVIAKLSPNVTSVTEAAEAAAQGGADILSLINTLVGTAVDIESRRPRLTNNRGGLSGPAIKPIALEQVNAVYDKVKLPLVGIGGISNYIDVIEFMLCGASAVQIGTALFVEPDCPVTIVRELKAYLKRKGLASVGELVGQLRKY